MKPVRIVVADSFPIVRDGTSALLQVQPGLEVIAEASDGDEALSRASEVRPDVLVMEMNMPGCPWHQVIKGVKRAAPVTSVLIVTMHRETHFAIPALRAGADGFVSKTQPTHDLYDAVRQIAEGKMFISPELSRHLAMKSVADQDMGALHERLTTRENEIFLLLTQGRTTSEIATRLHISPKTVSTHKSRIYQKLQLADVCALVRYAIDHELL